MQRPYIYSICLSLLLIFTLPTLLYAQKKKKDKKLSLTVEQWQNLKKEMKQFEADIQLRNAQELDLKSQASQQQILLEKAEKDILANENELGKLRGTNILKEPLKPKSRAYYRVQIGAYFNPALAQALQNQQNFEIEPLENGMKRYLVGKFTKFGEATKFAEKLRNANQQAFVVGYLDDKRIENLKQMPDEFKK